MRTGVYFHCVSAAWCVLQAHRGGSGTGSAALTLASSIAPCLCSNDFLHFSVISQAWNSTLARRMDISPYIRLAGPIRVEIAVEAEGRDAGVCCDVRAMLVSSH